jgi:hypothetical protein
MANLIDTDAKVITPGNYGYGHPTIIMVSEGFDALNTKLLLHLNGSDGDTSTTDEMGNSIGFNGDAELDDSEKKFGATSLVLDGTGDYLSVSANNLTEINGNYTIDFWVKQGALGATEGYMAGDSGSNQCWGFWGASTLKFELRTSGVTRFEMSGGSISDTTTWHHIAMCKVGSDWGIYLDGTQVAYVSNSSNFPTDSTLTIGRAREYTSLYYLTGNMDEVRICKSNVFNATPNSGKTDTITVPTSEYSSDGLGLIFAGHINDSGDLEIHKSIDYGSNWIIDTTITPSTGIEYFNLCKRDISEGSEIFVLYSDGDTTYKINKREIYETWALNHTISGITLNNRKALLRWDSVNDYLQIWWCGGASGYYVKSEYSTDGGDNWSAGANQGTNTNNHQIVDFDIKSNGNVLLAMERTSDSGTDKDTWEFNKTGTKQSDNNYSGGQDDDNYYTNLIINSAGNYFKVHYDNSAGEIQTFGIGGSQTWTISIDNLIAGIDGDDNIYVFYTKTSDNKTYYKKYNGSSWSSESEAVGVANNKFNCEKHTLTSLEDLNFVYFTA